MNSLHPCRDDRGLPVMILAPTAASAPSTWSDPGQVATFVPGAPVPQELNRIECAPATVPADTQSTVYAPPMILPHGLKPAAGAVILEPDGRIWLVTPTNHFGGYDYTFPKGRIESGAQPEETAVREVFEETGLVVSLTGWLGDFKRTTTYTRYFLAKRVGGTPARMGWESQAVHLVPRSRLAALLTHSADAPVLAALEQALRGGKACG